MRLVLKLFGGLTPIAVHLTTPVTPISIWYKICIKIDFIIDLREIRTWEKVRYNGGYVANVVRCNATRLYCISVSCREYS